jgi:sirohydrochlorin ferrochelatase
MPSLLVVDNGSLRPESILQLRSIARALARRLDHPVSPVSLLHASKIPADRLDGEPADTFEPFLRRQADLGEREFVVVPLFFGPSRAVTHLIPEVAEQLRATYGDLQIAVADVLCPLPSGEERLLDILEQHVTPMCAKARPGTTHIVVVDHGSPLPQVTAVRNWIAAGLASRLRSVGAVIGAAMERRPGVAYDFNGRLLESVLADIAADSPEADIVLAMQFISPGRHAGPGGDVEGICHELRQRYPRLQITTTPLVGEHPLLIDILASRVAAAVRLDEGGAAGQMM